MALSSNCICILRELTSIVKRGAEVLGVKIIPDQGAEEIGVRSRGTPRVALRLLRRVRDVAEVKSRSS